MHSIDSGRPASFLLDITPPHEGEDTLFYPGKGEVPATYMVVGMAPSPSRPKGRELEPFGSRSWKIIEMIRERASTLGGLYVTNLVKEAVPAKEKLGVKRIRKWLPYFYHEVDCVKPTRILALGAEVAATLCPGFKSLTEDHGTLFYNLQMNATVIPTAHFSAASYMPWWGRVIGRDIDRFLYLMNPPTPSYELHEDPDTIPDPPFGVEVEFDIETTGLTIRDGVTMIGLRWDEENHIYKRPTKEGMIRLGKKLKRCQSTLVGHNVQFDIGVMVRETDWKWPRLQTRDTMHMAAIEGEERLSLKHLVTYYTDHPGSRSGGNTSDPLYLTYDLTGTTAIKQRFQSQVKGRFIYQLLSDLSPIVAAMRTRGVYLDKKKLVEIHRKIEPQKKQALRDLNAQLREHGLEEEVNWEASAQVATALILCGVPLTEVTEKTGAYKTTENVLLGFQDHPVVQALLQYRATVKLDDSFVVPYLREVHEGDGFLHPNLKLTGTRTGRLSCANPNVQQIPREGPLKLAFVSRWPDGEYGAVDLAKAELVAAALLSGDKKMAHMLANDDFHTAMASICFQTPRDKLTAAQRKASKLITFGKLYGGSDKGLAMKRNLPVELVKDAVRQMFTELSDLAAWLEEGSANAIQAGYVETLFGRKRDLKDALKKEGERRAYRIAVNTPVQSLASDIMLAIIRSIDGQIRDRGLKSRPLFAVHDSCIMEIHAGERQAMSEVVEQAFVALWDTPLGEIPLFADLPLTGEFFCGPSWAHIESTNENYDKNCYTYPVSSGRKDTVVRYHKEAA